MFLIKVRGTEEDASIWNCFQRRPEQIQMRCYFISHLSLILQLWTWLKSGPNESQLNLSLNSDFDSSVGQNETQMRTRTLRTTTD